MKPAPLDQPFICRKGHITEAGWTGPHRNGRYSERCRTCYQISHLAACRKYNQVNAKKKYRYDRNRARTWGADKVNAAARRHHWRHRDKCLAYMKAWKKKTGYRRKFAPRLEAT